MRCPSKTSTHIMGGIPGGCDRCMWQQIPPFTSVNVDFNDILRALMLGYCFLKTNINMHHETSEINASFCLCVNSIVLNLQGYDDIVCEYKADCVQNKRLMTKTGSTYSQISPQPSLVPQAALPVNHVKTTECLVWAQQLRLTCTLHNVYFYKGRREIIQTSNKITRPPPHTHTHDSFHPDNDRINIFKTNCQILKRWCCLILLNIFHK